LGKKEELLCSARGQGIKNRWRRDREVEEVSGGAIDSSQEKGGVRP